MAMTLAEKEQLIAENQQKIYNAGFNKGLAEGKNHAIPEDKIVWNTVTGNPVSLHDVSEASHKIEIQLFSDSITDFSNTAIQVKNRNLKPDSIALGEGLYGSGVGAPVGVNKNIALATFTDIPLKASTYYTFSLKNTNCRVYRMCEMDKNDLCTVNHPFYFYNQNYATYSFQTNINTTYIKITLEKLDNTEITEEDVAEINFQLEQASASSSYIDNISIKLIGSPSGYYIIDNITDAPYLNLSVNDLNVQICVKYQQSLGYLETINTLWDSIQENGDRTDYSYAFYKMKDDMFYPKYDIKPTASAANSFPYSKIGNIKQRLSECRVKLDTSSATHLGTAFRGSSTVELPEINCNGVTSTSGITYLFYQATNLQTIDKVIINNSTITSFDGTFQYLSALENIIIEGEIAYNCRVGESKKLSKNSIISFINALSDASSGKTLTLSKTAVCTAFGVNDPVDSEEWQALIKSKENWTISLS